MALYITFSLMTRLKAAVIVDSYRHKE